MSFDIPAHPVTITKRFAIGKHEVTFAEYDRFAAATDHSQPDDAGWGCGKRPVVRVNGKDAVTYAEWLSRKTGKMQLHRFITAHDVATIINPITHQGQIDGGVIMGLGQAVMQELVMESGQVTNANLGDYKLPTVADIPELKTVLVRSGGSLAPFEAKAIGEFANNSPPAAVANALADAVGAGIFELPITAEKIYHALKEKIRQ